MQKCREVKIKSFTKTIVNKSHAAAYAVVAYETAYLKRYYPVEFFAAMLTSVMGNNDKVAFYIECCKKMGIKVLPPDINESNVTFTVKDGSIRFGLAAVKNVGRSVIISIINARKKKGRFTSFTDFCQKVGDGDINKRAVESLIKAGAFDSLGSYRSQLLAIYEHVIDGILGDRRRNIQGQISLFDMAGTGVEDKKDIVPNIKEFEKRYMLAMEKEMTGLYLSGHPLEEYREELEANITINTSEIQDSIGESEEGLNQNNIHLDNKIVTVGGILSSVRIKATKSNNIMAFAVLEDMFGSIEVLIFPKIYEKFNKLVQEDSLCLIRGRLSIREDEAPKLLAETIKPLKKSEGTGVKEQDKKLYLKIPMDRSSELINEIKPVLSAVKGCTPVYLCIMDDKTKKKSVSVASRELWVEVNDELLSRLYDILGHENVKVC